MERSRQEDKQPFRINEELDEQGAVGSENRGGLLSGLAANGLIHENREIEEARNERDRDDEESGEYESEEKGVFSQIRLTGSERGQTSGGLIREESFVFEEDLGGDLDEPVMMTVLRNYVNSKIGN